MLSGVEDARFGGRHINVCRKNYLHIETPQGHSCDMHEEKEEPKMFIKKLEIVKGGIKVTLMDIETNQSQYELVMDIKYADKIIIGNPMNLTFN